MSMFVNAGVDLQTECPVQACGLRHQLVGEAGAWDRQREEIHQCRTTLATRTSIGNAEKTSKSCLRHFMDMKYMRFNGTGSRLTHCQTFTAAICFWIMSLHVDLVWLNLPSTVDILDHFWDHPEWFLDEFLVLACKRTFNMKKHVVTLTTSSAFNWFWCQCIDVEQVVMLLMFTKPSWRYVGISTNVPSAHINTAAGASSS